MPEAGQAVLGTTTLRTLKKQLSVVSATLNYNMAALADPASGILASILLDSERVYVAARTGAALDSFQKATQIELDSL